MTQQPEAPEPGLDPAAAALAMGLQLIGLPANPADIIHQSGKSRLDESDLIRYARKLPVKVRFITSDPERLASTPMPVLAPMVDGRWLVVARIADGKVLAQNPAHRAPQLLPLEEFEQGWTGSLLLMTRRATLSDPFQRFGVAWFMTAIRKYRRPLIEVLIGSFFVQMFALLTPLFFQVVIDKVFVQRGLSTLEVLAVGMMALAVFDTVLGGVRTFVLAHTSNRIDVELGARLFRHLFALPMAYFHARRVGDTIARIRELDTIRQFLTSSALTLSLDLFFSLLFLIVLFLYSPLLTLIVAGALPLYVGLSISVTPIFRARLNERFKRGAENNSFLVEAVSGVETIKSMALEPVMQRRWEEQLAGYVRASFGVTTLNTFGAQIASFINRLTGILILFIGAKQVIDGHLTVGELIAFNMIAGQLSAPVLRIAQLWQDFQQVRISIDRTGDILNSTPEPGNASSARLPAIRGDIVLTNVNFRYRLDSQLILRDINLAIPAGQVIGIVGSSGSGKSTLAKLVQRLFVPETGNVTVDGHDVSLVDPSWLRRQIGVVLQENILFNRTVRDNIALADSAMEMERVIEAAQLAGAHDFIVGLPEGYNTMIGERGASLSGGQRQRIAIARALATNPAILIFDEATSALDYESEAAIQTNMQRICTGRTVLLIAHRLSTLRMADRIIAVEKGEIVEDGAHHALLAAKGRYASLWALQTADFAPAAGAA
jgi:subfamily B ATP-binding cassette protein HlyB/CyaB